MSSVTINGDTSGSITLAAPAVAGTTTVTFPPNTGTAMVSTGVNPSTANSVTHKISVVINGTTYYLLASTSSS